MRSRASLHRWFSWLSLVIRYAELAALSAIVRSSPRVPRCPVHSWLGPSSPVGDKPDHRSLFADQSPSADLNGVLGNYATLGLNIADFSRYANKPSAQNVQVIVIPIIFSGFPVLHPDVGFANHLVRQLSLACSVSSLPQRLRLPMAKSYGIQLTLSICGWSPDLMAVGLLARLLLSA